jgi:NAD(P)H-flavin reductase
MDQPRIKPQKFIAVLSEKEKISARVYRAVFTLKEPNTIVFRPGQNMMIYVAEGINRAISIGSPPQETTALTIYYDVMPGGPGSHWMLERNVGDSAQFMAPLGVFFFDAESTRKKVFVATGTGIAPFRSMILDYLASGGTTPLEVFWGLRHEEDIFLAEEFAKLAQLHPNLTFHITLSQPSENWQGMKGRVTAHIYTDVGDVKNCDFYLCGAGQMVSEVIPHLESLGVPRSQIKTELFYD